MRSDVMFPVAEKFISINGEGAHAGEIAAFVRFRKCNLNCTYCDTRWANSDDTAAEFLSADEIADWAGESGVRNITLTGGEPMLQPEIGELTDILISQGFRAEIETNGSIPIKNLSQRSLRPVFTMDYKCPSSGMENYMCLENFKYLRSHDTVKFVVGNYDDMLRAEEIIKKYSLGSVCHVYFSPVFGSIDPADMVSFTVGRHMNDVRIQLQMHKFIWSPLKRGV
ncbi:MAG: putative 7-carboxy-7-deazaguanine synthase QueE [Ruminococcus sp.]|nr:putative 7-carboxy-7-deazaguanine synthase QueE [Ruminococcus sp.]